MGTCCSWLMGGQESEETAEKAPILSGQRPTSRPQVTNTQSVRQYRPLDPDEENELLTSVEKLKEAEMKYIDIESLNKTFQDHAELYNNLFKSFKMMNDDVHEFKAMFAVDMTGVPVLHKSVTCLVSRCVGAKLEVGRSKYRVTICFDPKEVSRCCSSSPEDVLEALQLFNSVNKHVEEVLKHSPHVETSISILLSNEQTMRNDVIKVELYESEGPKCLKSCVDNLKQVKLMLSNIRIITRHAQMMFKDIVEASKGFFKEDES